MGRVRQAVDKPNGKPDGTFVKFENRPEFRREIKIEAGHAIRQLPGTTGPANNYGIDAMKVRMLLHGPHATVQFLFSTGIYPEKEGDRYLQHFKSTQPMAYDLGYHADVPQYEDQSPMECDLRGGDRCYYDGSSLQAEDVFDLLMFDGEDAVWQALQRYYDGLDLVAAENVELRVVRRELEAPVSSGLDTDTEGNQQ